LTSDLSSTCGSFDAQVMSRQFHLGQPVDLGPAGSVLRVALGGELITRVAMDPSLGESLDERLEWLHEQLYSLRQKIECLAALRSPSQLAPGQREVPIEPLATA
jgi:hypothetical protein